MPRAIVIDDNASAKGGHYNELSSLLLGAAVESGYEPALVAHQDFRENPALPAGCQILRCFTTRRMTRWSCGFDGQSSIARDTDSTPLSRTFLAHCVAKRDEWLTRAQWRPSEMLERWSDGLTTAIKTLNPTSDDKLLFQTADDFMMVAMARALSRFQTRRFCIKAIFHYAVHGVNGPSEVTRKAFDQQLNQALLRLKPHHDVTLFATTEPLAEQMNGGTLSQHVHSIAYPIRPTPNHHKQTQNPPRIVLGGNHRSEQGRDAVAPFLEAIYKPLVESGRCSLTLRLDPKRWQRIVPRSLHEPFAPAIERQARLNSGCNRHSIEPLPALDVQPATLSESDYSRMLSSADLGVLLYDSDRYKVRCSGVLLEFLARGVPVLAPGNCWLGTTVEAHSQPLPVGYTYGDSHEIPGLIERFLASRESLQASAQVASRKIAQLHSPATTFRTLLDTRDLVTPDNLASMTTCHSTCASR